jgi:hypothetical protein
MSALRKMKENSAFVKFTSISGSEVLVSDRSIVLPSDLTHFLEFGIDVHTIQALIVAIFDFLCLMVRSPRRGM